MNQFDIPSDHVRVLLVEDNPGDALLARTALQQSPWRDVRFDITHVTTLAAALDHGWHHRVDAVLLDLSLPDCMGLGTFQEVHLHLSDVPIVVLTGHDDEVAARAAMGAGAQDWLSKQHIDEHLLPRSVLWAVQRHGQVRQLEAALAERDAANEQLAEAARHQQEFVAVASHELRTPVTVLYGLIETLVRRWDDLDPERLQTMFEPLQRQGARLVQLVDDLLMVSRLDRGNLPLSLEDVDVPAIAIEVLGTSMLADEDVAISAPTMLEAVADAQALRSILRNLLDNAAKYGAAPYRVDLRHDDSWVEIVVEDRGEGVPGEFVPLLFEQFTQAEDSRTRRIGGTGLGLSIVAGLADALGGSVHYEPSDPSGARFVVRIPAAGHERTHRPVRVLVVDDAEDLHALVDAALASDDVVIAHANSPEESLEVFDAFGPDITVMGYMMPGTNGIEVARRLRHRAPEHHVVLWTAYLDDDVRRRARSAGIRSMLPKDDLAGLRRQIAARR